MSTTVILFIILALLGSYLIGCLQPSYLLGKAIKHVDIRDYGSGNSGGNRHFVCGGRRQYRARLGRGDSKSGGNRECGV